MPATSSRHGGPGALEIIPNYPDRSLPGSATLLFLTLLTPLFRTLLTLLLLRGTCRNRWQVRHIHRHISEVTVETAPPWAGPKGTL
jgi:hypothetical protein